ncbi:hypothetical protein [Sulfitobacter sp. MF3-043]|uniref:hypothetical protein n=1 Tax=Sulfitobacter sediminivivens TaxID=3252902 RepID=UPI0036DEBCCD
MNRYQDPKHPDCWIECPGSGTAVYADPPGRCIKNCGEDGLAESLRMMLPFIRVNVSFSISTSLPFVGIYDLLTLPFDQLDNANRYQQVLRRLQEIDRSGEGKEAKSDFIFSGQISLLDLLVSIANHFGGEQAAKA